MSQRKFNYGATLSDFLFTRCLSLELAQVQKMTSARELKIANEIIKSTYARPLLFEFGPLE